jgi:CheY-like chemotaxis protein
MKEDMALPVILNVDDDEAGRYVVSRQLKKAGYDIVEAANGADALRLAEEHKPDLILLDVRLPDMDGFEVCRRIRANPRISGIPVLQLSASYRDVTYQVKGLENGADGYLTEPAEPEFLAATINSLLRMKGAEQLVLRAARQWDATFHAIQDGIALLDLEGQVVQANQAYAQLAALDPAHISVSLQKLLQRLRSTGTRVAAEETLQQRAISITMDCVLGEKQEICGAVCLVADVTERNQFELNLRQTQKLESLGVLAGGIAHDFNNLLVGILGNASLAGEMVPAGGPVAKLLDDVVMAGQRAAHLTRQMLAYAGKGRFIIERVDLSSLVADMTRLVDTSIPKNVELHLELDRELPAVEADAGQMQQVVMNLVLNAAESIGAQAGAVTVRTGARHLDRRYIRKELEDAEIESGAYVFLEVQDTGCGMDETTKSRIFDPFFTTKFTGRGLGLAAVTGIVRGHKGAIRVKSTPGQGSTFIVFFPAANAPRIDAPVLQAPSKTELSGAGTILVVDDEDIVLRAVKIGLERQGYQVLQASSGGAAIELFQREQDRIVGVLLDSSMPGMGGHEVLPELRRIKPDIHVIVSSGYSEAETMRLFSGQAISGFLQKPYTSTRLAEEIKRALQRG